MLLVITKRWHGKHSYDSIIGVQKFHCSPTPRVGGIAIFFGLTVALLCSPKSVAQLLGSMLIAALPAFTAGLTEDVTKGVSVRIRLVATMISGVIACILTGYSLNRMDLIGIDILFAYLPISIAFTAFAVAGVANAINIIDGFNGLASGVLIICFSAFGIIAWQAGDIDLAQLCVMLNIVIAGFFTVNFPFGKIFMGDGGAYLLGFILAWVAVMLPMRNPTVSVWVSLLVCAYPVIETCFSILRKYNRKGHNPGMPDNVHLHMLVYSRVARVIFSKLSPALKNGFTSLFIWPYSLICMLLAILFPSNTIILILGVIVCVLVYWLIYLRLTQFVWCLRPATLSNRKAFHHNKNLPALTPNNIVLKINEDYPCDMPDTQISENIIRVITDTHDYLSLEETNRVQSDEAFRVQGR
jgi:UDP-N-acetylmuramyl pentapeptide phosphotransferase/UDP-N-acetylglucosamine-1-phosphate transferase